MRGDEALSNVADWILCGSACYSEAQEQRRGLVVLHCVQRIADSVLRIGRTGGKYGLEGVEGGGLFE